MVSLPLSIAMVTVCLSLVAYVLTEVRKGLQQMDGVRAAVRFRWVLVVGLLWLIYSGALAYSGFLREWQAVPPRFLALILPMALGWLWLALHPVVGQFARAASLRWLTGVQTFRFAAEAFIWFAVLEGAMPELLTFHGAGRNYDILTPVLALVLVAIWPRLAITRYFHAWLWAFNAVGLALLFNVVAHAILSSPQFLLIPADPPNTIFAGFPGVWLPAVMVWLAGALHILSIRNLRQHSA